MVGSEAAQWRTIMRRMVPGVSGRVDLMHRLGRVAAPHRLLSSAGVAARAAAQAA
jgi:hypothetical protein